jgi:methionine sulfoxide reductase heme-binding subunit
MSSETLWYVSRAAGVVSLVLFTATLVLGILTAGRASATAEGRAGTVRLHRNISLIALLFLVLHIVTAIVDGYVDLGWLDVLVPFGSGFDPLWIGLGAVAVDLMIAVAVTSALRRHLSRTVWRAVHLTSYAMWPIAVLHGLGTEGGDASSTWMIATTVACGLVVLAALGVRLTRRSDPDRIARSTGDLVHPRVPEGAAR